MNKEIMGNFTQKYNYTITPEKLKVVTLSQRPDLRDKAQYLIELTHPKFMRNYTVNNPLWVSLLEQFSDFQFVICSFDDDLLSVINTIPLQFDQSNICMEKGWDGALMTGISKKDTKSSNSLCALSISIGPASQGHGLGRTAVRLSRAIARDKGFDRLVLPLRPILKSKYPLIAFEKYISWKEADGSPFDPWLRVHTKLDGLPLGIADDSITIHGSIQDWEMWTGMRFPETGSYIIPEAMIPIRVDREQNAGIYIEPNLWVQHIVSIQDKFNF